jgi:hypothetical protein
VRRSAWERWQAAAGPWKGWSICPALLAPEGDDVTPRVARRPTAGAIAISLAKELTEGGVVVVLELEPILGVRVAARLNQQRLANAVLVLPRWPYVEAILPVDQLVDTLVRSARHLAPEGHLPNVAFVLDTERMRAVPHRSAGDGRADNRYRLSVADLPDLRTLRRRGIRKVLKLSQA